MSTNVSGIGNSYQNTWNTVKTDDASAKGAGSESTAVKGTKSDYGRTIGKPQLSEKAESYYKELKEKFGNLDFILVSKDQKENAKAMAGNFANPYRMVVLIDEEKIERMAADENFRAKYEGMIANAASGLKQLKAQVESSGQGDNVKGYGLVMNDNGTATFFAALKKTSEAQKARIEAKLEQNREEKKAEAKEAEKAAEEEKLKSGKTGDRDDLEEVDDVTVIITANGVEELMKKIDEYYQNDRMNSVRTEAELQVGQHIDFRG